MLEGVQFHLERYGEITAPILYAETSAARLRGQERS